MIILGIDPGTATSGWGILDINGKSFKVMDFGLIETDKEIAPADRLLIIHDKMSLLLDKHNPDVVAIERLFFATNAKTAMRVGQAQGVMLYCASKFQKEVYEYAPGTIKKMVSGNGRADKKMMQQSLRKHLGAGVRSRPKARTHFDNAADALAVALCHAFKINGNEE